MIRVSLSPTEFKELLLSHHPNSPDFNSDVVILFGRRICAGCLFAYPTALLTLLIFSPYSLSSITISILLAVISQFRRISENQTIQNFFRMIAGIALGFGLGGGYWAIIEGNYLMVFFLLIGAGIYATIKALSMKRKMENHTRSKN